jgi:hypothetical protein
VREPGSSADLRTFKDCSFSSAWKKTNQKKTPVSRFFLRFVDTAGARGNSPAYGKPSAGSDKSARFDPAASPMLGAGQRENTKIIQHTASRGLFAPVLREEEDYQGSIFTGDLSQAVDCVSRQGRSPFKAKRRFREGFEIKACKP